MPLGKLSRKQLQHAFSVLSDLDNIIDSSDEKIKKDKIIVTTNMFYSLIPHDFGMKTPQVIDSKEIINVCIAQFTVKYPFIYKVQVFNKYSILI